MSGGADLVPVDTARLWARLLRLAEIGGLPGGGVDRQALTVGEAAAWRLLLSWAAEGGFAASADPVGNLFLTLPGLDRALPPTLVGSHIDTQPTGGKFDGALGVLAALEAALAIAAGGTVPARDIVVVAWMNEEGSRFAPGMLGSAAFAGALSLDEALGVRDAAGCSVREALEGLFGQVAGLPRRTLGFTPHCYLELHIEQGIVLERAGKPIGIVTGIQGKTTWEVTVTGEEGHAGTLPMAERRDAVAAFVGMAQALQAGIGMADPLVKFTIGRVHVSPNAPSVVPGRVMFRIDLRHPDHAVLEVLGRQVEALTREHAGACSVAVDRLSHAPSNGFDPALRAAIDAAAGRRGYATMPLLSAAGHDARYLARLCPSAMIFIPSRGGVSHAEHEWSEPGHVAAGAEVLADVLWSVSHP